MSGAPTPSEQGSPLAGYLDLRDSLREVRSGRGGRDVCEQLTGSLDGAIRSLVSPVPEGTAVVAVGGYGRGEMSLYSDVDLMLLHSGGDRSELAAALFRPLWDAKLRVGHAVRTLGEAAAAARERFDTQTTLLTGRLVTGDDELFDRLTDEVAGVTRARPLRRYLVSEERARREADPFLLMATDLKNGRGGMRTLQGFGWERRREELIGRFSEDSSQDEERVRDTLLRVRNSLHAAAGRSHDVYSPDLRERAARWLGMDVLDSATELVEAMQTVDGLASRRWPEVLVERPRIWARLSGRPAESSATRPPTLEDMVWILETGEAGRVTFDRLWEAGLLDDLLSEWGVVRTLPELAPFHEHPVAPHLWRTVGVVHRLIEDTGHMGRVADEVNDPVVLLLAALLHDVGKGQGGNHAEVGARIARSFCAKMSVDADRAVLIEGAVRHHLLLSVTATRRDLDDPAVIDEITATVGSLRQLQVIYLLTVADSTATGRTMWGEWKATLVRTLFLRCAARFDADRSRASGATRQEVLAAVGSGRAGVMAAHLDDMPDDYLRSVTVDDVVWHHDLVEALEGVSNLGVRHGQPVETVVVVGSHCPGFRHVVAEAFAANGVDVLEARLFSRGDGMLVDSFQVRDDRTGAQVEPGKWDQVRADLEAGLRGGQDTGSKVVARAAAYREAAGSLPEVHGTVDPATGDLVLTIGCGDRIGRLAEILSILGDCGLEIRLAKIDSREGGVIDTFHVPADRPGREMIADLETRIAGALRP